MPKTDKKSNNACTIVFSLEANISHPAKDAELILEQLNSALTQSPEVLKGFIILDLALKCLPHLTTYLCEQ